MRPPRRLLLRLQAALILSIIIAVPFSLLAQNSNQLPPQWNDAVSQLADKVAAAVSPATVTLNVANISSLEASYAGVVEAELRTQLERHSFSLASKNSPAAQSAVRLQFTLSESANEYVWVLEILNSSNDDGTVPPIIVAVPKTDFTDGGSGGQFLTLGKRLIWAQPGRFLDFSVEKGATSGQPSLLVLESSRLAVYALSGSEWVLSRSNPFPQAVIPSRSPDGTINLKDGSISVGAFKCVGDPDVAVKLKCGPAEQPRLPFKSLTIPRLPSSLGTNVPGRCRNDYISLYSAEGDWTQPDSIQGYLVRVELAQALPSGSAIQFNGPVIALQADPDTSSARAIVHNLKTGNYEAYIVTATCGN
jgi:hypothetical protein